MTFAIEPMHMDDIPQVIKIEEATTTLPWPASAYKRELKNPRSTRYLVVRDYGENGRPNTGSADAGSDEKKPFLANLLPFLFNEHHERGRNPYPLVGYGGLWLMLDEAHITTIGIIPEFQGRKLGELLLVGLTDVAMQMGASWLTLEVRVSNTVAQNLYKKYTFKESGVRKKYYTDNNEDAYVMWSDEITKLSFREKYAELKRNLYVHLESKGYLPPNLDPTQPLVRIDPNEANSEVAD